MVKVKVVLRSSGVIPFANDLGGIASLLQQLWKQDLRVWDTSNYVLGSIRCGRVREREEGREGGRRVRGREEGEREGGREGG